MSETKNQKCPFCEKILNTHGNIHIYGCNKHLNLNRLEIKFKFIEFNYPEICSKADIEREYVVNKMSLPEFKKKYNISSGLVVWLLNHYNIKKRTLSESGKMKKTRTKFKKTMIDKWGSDNPSRVETIKKKRTQTFQAKYGVDNAYQIPEVIDYLKSDTLYLEKYNKTRKQFFSELGKLHWKNMTELERSIHLKTSCLGSGCISKLEKSVTKHFIDLCFNIETQYNIKNNYYDILLKDYDILIEVNGDYWHANPELYKSGDLIKYPGNKLVSVDEKWEQDKTKRLIAEEQNFKVIYIWENDWKKLKTTKEKDELLKGVIYANCKNQIN